MDTQAVERKIVELRAVIKTRLPQQSDARRVAVALRELYATKSAAEILLSLHGLCPERIDSARDLAQAHDKYHIQPHLPSVGAVENATPRLLNAVASRDWNETVVALTEMGMFELFPTDVKVFNRLELRVGCVNGRARLIPLVELALFAAELGAYERAVAYVSEANTLGPEPPELHDIHTLFGLMALAAGDTEEAKRRLAQSTRVCREDEYARITCGIRPFNLELAKKLLQCEESSAVLEYLTECKEVWAYEAKRIDTWIEAIHNGREPYFFAPSARSALDRPAARIRDLTLRSVFLAGTPKAAMQEPNHGVRAEVGKMRGEYKRDIAAAMKGKLKTGRN